MTNRHDDSSEFYDYDPFQQSENGSAAAGETDCPLCDETQPKTELPAHIRDEHSTR